MFNKDTIPPIFIEEGDFDDVFIQKIKHKFFLYKNDINLIDKTNKELTNEKLVEKILKSTKIQLMGYNTKNLREYKELYSSYDLAYGDVLLTGLGFGMLATWIASKPGVTSVTVLEYSQGTIDHFLKNNELPKNMTIKQKDANKYKSKKHFDCILLDHVPEYTWKSNYDYYLNIAKNIPNHNIFWFWPLEHWYICDYYGFKINDFYTNPPVLSNIDLYEKWENFRNDLNIDTIPVLSKEKVTEYLYTYFNYIAINNII